MGGKWLDRCPNRGLRGADRFFAENGHTERVLGDFPSPRPPFCRNPLVQAVGRGDQMGLGREVDFSERIEGQKYGGKVVGSMPQQVFARCRPLFCRKWPH